MQCSRALRTLPVALAVAAGSLAAQSQYQIAADGEWFHQEPGQRRLARLARGARVTEAGAVDGQWVRVTIEGWIVERSVGPATRPGFDLSVTKSPEENLRALGKRHKELSGSFTNWLGTYEHAAERFVKHLNLREN